MNRVRAICLISLLLATAMYTTAVQAAGVPGEPEGFDWSLLISLTFGVVGLIWVRRRISQL